MPGLSAHAVSIWNGLRGTRVCNHVDDTNLDMSEDEYLALFSEVLFEMCFMTSGRHRGRLESRRMSLLTNPAVLR